MKLTLEQSQMERLKYLFDQARADEKEAHSRRLEYGAKLRALARLKDVWYCPKLPKKVKAAKSKPKTKAKAQKNKPLKRD